MMNEVFKQQGNVHYDPGCIHIGAPPGTPVGGVGQGMPEFCPVVVAVPEPTVALPLMFALALAVVLERPRRRVVR